MFTPPEQSNQPNKLAQILQALGALMPKIAPQQPQQPGGQVMSPARFNAPMGMPSPTQISPATPNTPFNPQTEFNTRGGARGATTQNALAGLSKVMTDFQNRKQQKEQRKAENYFSQIIAAQSAGDQETLNVLLEDPKVIKTLEKGMDYYLPKMPGELPTMEAKALHSALKKQQSRLPAPNTPGGVMMPQMNPADSARRQMDQLAQQEALKKLQGDPSLAAQTALGTGLSGQERAQSERISGGLGISEAQKAQLSAEQQKTVTAFEEFRISNETELKKVAAEIQRTGTMASAEKEAARIHVGPLYERAKIARDLGMAAIRAKQEIAGGKTSQAMKTIMTTLSSQIDNLRTNAAKAKKDGNDDLSTSYMTQADTLQKQYDDARKSSEFDVDTIIRDIFASPEMP